MSQGVEDRWVETALREACGGELPPDVADRVVHAAQRPAMVSSSEVIPRLPGAWWTAAGLLLGATVVFGIAWIVAGAAEPEAVPARPLRQEPERVVPRSASEFREMLGEVEGIDVIAMQRSVAHPTRPVFDLRRASAEAVVSLDPAAQQAVLDALRAGAEAGPQGPPGTEHDREMRLVVRLRGHRELHCLARSDLRVFSVAGQASYISNDLWANAGKAFFTSQMLASAALGFVGAPIELRAPRRQRFDPESTRVTLGPGFHNGDLSLLRHFDGLRELDLTWSKVNRQAFTDWDEELREVFSQLQTFSFRDSGLDDASLAYLAEVLPQLRVLDLSQAVHLPAIGQHLPRPTRFGNVTGTGFVAFSQGGALRSVDVSGHDKLTDAGLTALLRLPGIQRLDLSFCERSGLSVEGFASLPQAVELRSLAVGQRTLDDAPAAVSTDSVLALVGGLVNLHTLSLAHSNATLDGLKQIRDLPLLRALDLSYCKELEDAAIEWIAWEFPSLQVLDLRGSATIALAEFEKLQVLEDLEELHLLRRDFEAADRETLANWLGARVHWHR